MNFLKQILSIHSICFLLIPERRRQKEVALLRLGAAAAWPFFHCLWRQPPPSLPPSDVLSCSTTHRSTGGLTGQLWCSLVKALIAARDSLLKCYQPNRSSWVRSVSSLLPEGFGQKCRLHLSSRRALPRSGFVRALLNYLGVCLKKAQGSFSIDYVEAALHGRKTASFHELQLINDVLWGNNREMKKTAHLKVHF